MVKVRYLSADKYNISPDKDGEEADSNEKARDRKKGFLVRSRRGDFRSDFSIAHYRQAGGMALDGAIRV
jgi:hypothetical protein